MKTRITLLIAAVALVTLSFTFASVENPATKESNKSTSASVSEPVGGLVVDQVAE
jgi:hypothetical protein